MSDIEDCASEEIDASTSSISTRNSKKQSFLRSLLNIEDDRLSAARGNKNIVLNEKRSKLLIDEKRDFIENWIISHNGDSLRNSTESSCPTSPILGIKREKRLAQSPILGCCWKRSRRIVDTKNRTDICSNKTRLKRKKNITREFETIVQNENSRPPKSEISDDLDTTLTASNLPTLNVNANSLTLSVNGVWGRLPWTTEGNHETAKESESVEKVKNLQEIDDTSEIRIELSNIPSTFIIESQTENRNENACKFLWHRGKSTGVKRSFQSVKKFDNERISPDLSNSLSRKMKNKYSRDSRQELYVDNRSNLGIQNSLAIKQEEITPVRSKGYQENVYNSFELTNTQMFNSRQIKTERIVIDSSSSNDRKENLTINNENRLSNIKQEEESPMRWNYRHSQIRDNFYLPETLSLSLPLTVTDENSPKSSFMNKSKRNLNDRDRSKNPSLEKKKNLVKLEDETLLRWNGYGNETCEAEKASNSLSINSPLIETEQIIMESSSNDDLQENFHIDNRSRTSSRNSWLERRNLTFVKIEERSSSTLNGSKTCNSLMLQATPSLSPPVMEIEGMIRESTFTSDSQEMFNIDNRILLSCGNYSLRSKNCSVKEDNSPLKRVGGEIEEISCSNWNGQKTEIRSFSILPETISSSQIIDKELPVVKKEESDWENHENRHSESTLKSKNRREELSSHLPEIERIDEESCPSYGPDEYIQIESDSEATVSDVIENTPTQNLKFPETRCETVFESRRVDKLQEKFIERKSRPEENESYDSDETYCSNAEPMQQEQPEVRLSRKTSQLISQVTTNSCDSAEDSANKSNTLISETSSPMRNNTRFLEYLPAVNTTNNAKKKKTKKGSLVAKLQSLVKLQISNLKIWQHQMTLSNFKSSSMQFVTMRIRKSAMHYGRYFLIAETIEDTYGLLNNSLDLDVNSTSSTPVTQVIALMIIPEINGMMKIRDNSAIKIYPPWEVIDKPRRVLNIIYFEASQRNGENKDSSVKNVRSSRVERIVEKFDCPCIERNTLRDTCNVKFSNEKPSVMQAIFDS